MRRLVLTGILKPGTVLDLDRDKSRYLIRVLRMGEGDRFQAMDEGGRDFDCRIVAASNRGVRVELEEPRRAAPAIPSEAHPESDPPAPDIRIALVQALPKAQKMDLVVRQAVEAGAAAVFPLISRNCVAREPSDSDKADKLERRRKIVTEALQQSGSRVLTKVFPATESREIMDLLAAEGYGGPKTLFLLCHETPLAGKSLHEYCAGDPEAVVVMVGPEGGFDPSEVESFLAAGFLPIHFGGSVLRTETAALYALAAVKTILAERKTWIISK